jgi:hypothetical protein
MLSILLHAVHAGGADTGWIGPFAISFLIIVVLSIDSLRSRK